MDTVIVCCSHMIQDGTLKALINQVRILLVGALYGPLGSSSPSARNLLQTLLKKLDGSTPGTRESPSTTAMVGLEAVANQAKKSVPQVNASKAFEGLDDVDMENYNTTGDSLANSQVPSIEDNDETKNRGSSCQQEVMKDESAALLSNEINAVVPQGSADVDRENYYTTEDSLTNSQVPSIEDDDETTNKVSSCQQEVMKDESTALPSNEINADNDETKNRGSSCQQEVMKDESAALLSNEINAVVPQGSADVDRENYYTTGDSLANSQVPSIEDNDETKNRGSSCQQEAMKDESAALLSNEINGVVPQGSADVDMENYNTPGDSHVPAIEDYDGRTNKGSSCQQEVMKDESTALPSNEINAGVPDEDSNSFHLGNVSTAAKNRVHSFVLDLVNTTSSQLDTSSHLNQLELTTSESVEAGPGPVKEDSSGYTKVLMLSLKGNDSLESTAMSSAKKSAPQVNASKASQGLADADMENYNTTGDSLANSQVPSIEDEDDTNNQGSSCQQEVMKDESAALPSNGINAGVPDEDSNSFYLGNVSMAAKNRVDSFVLDLVNTTSSQLDTSSHLNQLELTTSASVEAGPGQVIEDSSGYTKVLMLSLKGKDSSESTAMSSGVPDEDSNSFHLGNVSTAAKNRVHSFVLDLVNTTSSQLDTSSHLNQLELTTSASVEAGPGQVIEDSSGYTKVLMLSLKGKDSSESTAMSSAKKSAPQVNASKVSQGLADVDMENYNTTGDSLANSQVQSIEDNDETNNQGSSCQQEAMKDESAALLSNEINAGVPDEDSNSFHLGNVSMAAKNRVHSFVLDPVNATSSQLDASSYLNQPELTTSESVEAGPGPLNEDSSGYTKALMLSLKGKDSSESTAMSSGNKRKRKRSIPESLDTSEKESDEPLQKSQCLIMETNLHQTDEPLPKVPWLTVEKTDSSTAKVTIEHMHPPGEPTDSWTSTGKGISPEAEGKTRKRKRRDSESLDTSEKECDEPLRKSRCLVAETNENFPQAEEPDSHENFARVRVENATNPEALEYAHLCIRNAYHALLGAGILEHQAAVMAPENVTIQPQVSKAISDDEATNNENSSCPQEVMKDEATSTDVAALVAFATKSAIFVEVDPDLKKDEGDFNCGLTIVKGPLYYSLTLITTQEKISPYNIKIISSRQVTWNVDKQDALQNDNSSGETSIQEGILA
ncbi:hypothetical protein AWC38_SpisGene723 [Stylophora pistillata]|uniref:Uncharacterized protein n=1 Tax=Stylophora pistillata TaxID=50429 RepID=A0A2B4T1I1_STYPI|nr:hypothetical protein AWC38_SpisGene723 [Stylophora pistillata]